MLENAKTLEDFISDKIKNTKQKHTLAENLRFSCALKKLEI